jgi:CRP-like cAMP-binding protein
MPDPNLRGEVFRRLSSTVPFRYLRAGELEALAADSVARSYAPGEVLVEQGEAEGQEVFVLASGSAESLDVSREPPFRLNVVEAGSLFGERSALFGEPRRFEVRALEPSLCIAIPGARFLRLLSESRPFAEAFGAKLRLGLGLFDAFERFEQEVQRGVARGHVEIRRLAELYKELEPALHPRAKDEGRIDWGALSYAVRRLPDNICHTFVFLLTDNLPTVYASPEQLFPAVRTEARRRFIYEMLPGKDMALMRNGSSDLVDFLSCLCLFAVEARKIRYRLNHPDMLRSLSRFEEEAEWVEPLEASEEGAVEAAPRPAEYYEGDIAAADLPPGGSSRGAEACRNREALLLERLPFDASERAELERIWPGRVVEVVREIVFHRQAYSVDIRKQVNNYNGRLSELWASEVGAAAGAFLGVRPSDFPPDYEVHLVSSNTHSVSNCLNPFFSRNAGEILGWAEERGLRAEVWPGPAADEVYHLSRVWLEAFPERRRELAEAEREAGILRLPETVTTGIQVELIDADIARRLPIDPAILAPGEGREGRRLIVNIDYAFGEQAEEIMRNLLLLFGRSVRSISVLGKAGALEGSRGDFILPTAFVEQSQDSFLSVSAHNADAAARLAAALPERRILEGPLLTVAGTLLQNRAMLQFYRRVWGCVGLEMEGSWYLRAIHEAEALGVLAPGASLRFIYYVSDLPLEAGQGLSARLRPVEGLPPLYAATREVLQGILGAGSPARGPSPPIE